MAAKRALVVDDSKSARAFLSSLLEKHHLEVDAAESAEDAIEYLTRHRPDVIFMDHLMPGMDGFQAVQAIKTNPRTATIPILMYTSQEGELYLGQARALGAIGVLPKQIAPADVTKVLHQLRLAEDRRVPAASSPFIPIVDADANAETVIAPRPGAAPAGETDSLVHAAHAPVPPDVLLRDQIAELRRFMVTSLDEQTERLLEDVRLMMRDVPRDGAQETPQSSAAGLLPKPPLDRRWLGLALAASIAALLFAGLWLNESADRRALQQSLRATAPAAPVAATGTAATAALAGASSAESAAIVPGAAAGTAPARPVAAVRVPPLTVLPVPFGEMPLAGARVERLRSLLAELAQSGFRGSVDVHTYPGRYCLTGNDNEGYSLAPDDLPYTACDVVGNPADERQGSSQRQSLPFASMIAERRKASDGAIDIRISSGSADQILKSYPEMGGDPPHVPGADEWNSAAAANNRVEVRWTRSN